MAEFNITPIPIKNENNEIYVLAQFEELKEELIKAIDLDKLYNLVISDNDDLKFIKAKRTELRKLGDTFKSVRLNVTEIVLGQFTTQSKELEALIKEADDLLKAKKESYEADVLGKVKEKTYSLTIKSKDLDVINKIKKFALKQDNVEIVEK